jgi:hypothetical protein
MNKKQAVFLRRFSARVGTPMKQLKRAWYSLPWNKRYAWKKILKFQMEQIDSEG